MMILHNNNNNNNNSHIYYTHKFAKCLLSDTAACGRNCHSKRAPSQFISYTACLQQTGRHHRNTLWLMGFKHPLPGGARNDSHDLSRGWDLNRRPSERNSQASALDHSATRPRPKTSAKPKSYAKPKSAAKDLICWFRGASCEIL